MEKVVGSNPRSCNLCVFIWAISKHEEGMAFDCQLTCSKNLSHLAEWLSMCPECVATPFEPQGWNLAKRHHPTPRLQSWTWSQTYPHPCGNVIIGYVQTKRVYEKISLNKNCQVPLKMLGWGSPLFGTSAMVLLIKSNLLHLTQIAPPHCCWSLL